VCTNLVKPYIYCPQVVVVVSRATLHLGELRLDGGLFTLVFAHLSEDGIFLESLRVVAMLVFILFRQMQVRLEGVEPQCLLSMAGQRRDAASCH